MWLHESLIGQTVARDSFNLKSEFATSLIIEGCATYANINAPPAILASLRMPQISLAPRNVFVFDGTTSPPNLVAGFHQFGSTTSAEFYYSLNICFYQPAGSQYRLRSESGTLVQNDQTVLPLGNYFVVSIGTTTRFHALTGLADSTQYVPVVLCQETARYRTRSPAGTSARVCFLFCY